MGLLADSGSGEVTTLRAPDLLTRNRRRNQRSSSTAKAPQPSRLARLRRSGRSRTGDALVERIALAATAVTVALFWLPSLFRSLWTDEAVALWTIDTSLSNTVDRASSLQESSAAYYVLVNLWAQIAGTSEFVLRLPSFVAGLAAAYLVYELGRGLHRRVTGLIAAFIFVGFQTVFIGATSVTPFALEVLLLLVSARALMWWVADPRLSHGVAWIVTAVGAVYMFPFAIVVLVAHAAFLRTARSRGLVRDIPQLAALVTIGGLALVPLVPQFMDLFQDRALLLLEGTPSVTDLLIVLIPPVVIAGWLVGLAFVRRISDEPAVSGEPAVLIVVWAVLPALVAFGVSILSGYTIWSGRYYIAALPALAILLGGMFSRLTSTDGRRIAVVLLIALTFLATAPSSGSTIEEDWRGAVEWTNAQAEASEAVVLVSSGLPQSRDVGLLLNPAFAEYLLSPVRAYGLQPEARPLPFEPSNDAAAYIDLAVNRQILDFEQVVVISRVDQGFADYGLVIAAGLANDGFMVVARPTFSGLEVTLLQRG
jgi:hypothetical protein